MTVNDPLPGAPSTALRTALALCWVGLVGLTIAELALFGGGRGHAAFAIDVGYAVVAFAAVLLALAARRRASAERTGWLLLSAVLITPALGGAFLLELMERVGLTVGDDLPAWGAALSLGYVLAAAGSMVVLRSRLGRVWRSVWLDGMIAGLTVTAVATMVVAGFAAPGPDELASVRTVYVVGDVLLASVAVVALSLTSWRSDPELPVIGAIVVAVVVAHVARVTSTGSVTLTGTAFDALIAAALLLIVGVVWRPGPRELREHPDSRRMHVALALCGVVAIGVLVYAEAIKAGLYVIVLVGAVLLAWIARAAVTVADQRTLLTRLDAERLTDALTGLGNRRRLTRDLNADLQAAERGEQRLLVLIDLDDFKAFNDRFGHMEGDALLCRVAERLAAISRGRAYRLGGDEFCMVLAPGDLPRMSSLTRALTFELNGVVVTAAHGSVALGGEIRSFDDALRAADDRLYRGKLSRRGAGARLEARELTAVWLPAMRKLPESSRTPDLS